MIRLALLAFVRGCRTVTASVSENRNFLTTNHRCPSAPNGRASGATPLLRLAPFFPRQIAPLPKVCLPEQCVSQPGLLLSKFLIVLEQGLGLADVGCES